VGRDAEVLAANRSVRSDEEWIAGLTMADDAQWRANMKAGSATEVPGPG
jgi:hypothetical protein